HQRDRILAGAAAAGRGAYHRAGGGGGPARTRGGGARASQRPMTTLPFEVQCTHRPPLRAESRRRMRLVLGIAAAVMVAEAVGGYAAGSLALLADAGHMLTDVAALGLALVVADLCERPGTAEPAYGLQRPEVLAALVHGVTLSLI